MGITNRARTAHTKLVVFWDGVRKVCADLDGIVESEDFAKKYRTGIVTLPVDTTEPITAEDLAAGGIAPAPLPRANITIISTTEPKLGEMLHPGDRADEGRW